MPKSVGKTHALSSGHTGGVSLRSEDHHLIICTTYTVGTYHRNVRPHSCNHTTLTQASTMAISITSLAGKTYAIPFGHTGGVSLRSEDHHLIICTTYTVGTYHRYVRNPHGRSTITQANTIAMSMPSLVWKTYVLPFGHTGGVSLHSEDHHLIICTTYTVGTYHRNVRPR